MDRASDYESAGWVFESPRAHLNPKCVIQRVTIQHFFSLSSPSGRRLRGGDVTEIVYLYTEMGKNMPPKNVTEEDEKYMKEALKEAKKAYKKQEVPVGAVVVYQNKIISRSYNQSIKLNDPTAHAEILAIRKASKHLSNYRLLKTRLYVTVEPCMMCLGALAWARVEKVVFGTKEPKFGVMGPYLNIIKKRKKVNHSIKVCGGVLEKESKELIQKFFKHRRKK